MKGEMIVRICYCKSTCPGKLSWITSALGISQQY